MTLLGLRRGAMRCHGHFWAYTETPCVVTDAFGATPGRHVLSWTLLGLRRVAMRRRGQPFRVSDFGGARRIGSGVFQDFGGAKRGRMARAKGLRSEIPRISICLSLAAQSTGRPLFQIKKTTSNRPSESRQYTDIWLKKQVKRNNAADPATRGRTPCARSFRVSGYGSSRGWSCASW